MRKYFFAGSAIIVAAFVVCWAQYGQRNQPVYVGSRVCGKCHQGKGMGHQHSLWLNSKHWQAYAVLSNPESKRIALLSGIPEEPQKSVICLGCHATGAHAEDWERDEMFFIEDGVQCEKCHGPGSEYVDTMSDLEESIKSGLIIPTLEDCMKCHQRKDSHVLVRGVDELDMDAAMKRLAHPTPEMWKPSLMATVPEGDGEKEYIGVHACGKCHSGPEKGYQFSKWRMSKHARGYAVLATARAYEIAEEEGLRSEPQSSAECLKCHTTAYWDPSSGGGAEYSLDEGVGCEACHGAGSDHLEVAAGLKDVSEQTCMGCHENAHGKDFDYSTALEEIAHGYTQVETVEQVVYKTPLNMAVSPDGKEIYVACEASESVIVVDAVRLEKAAEIPVGRYPNNLAFSPDGGRVYVSNRLDDTVSVIDVSSRRVVATIEVGDEPHGVLTDESGRLLYVLNTATDNISVIDTKTLKEVKRLSASRQPWSLALTPDGSQIYVTNNLSRFVEFRTPSVSEVTVIDTDTVMVSDRIEVAGANLLQGIEWHPSGEFGLFTMNRTKNLIPMTRLLQGWTITNGLGIVWKDGRVDQVLLDEPGLYFPDPTDVAITVDGRFALVTSSGSDRIAVVDVDKLVKMVKSSSDHERGRILPNHLGRSTEFIVKHIDTNINPRGIVIGGRKCFVTNSLDDSLTVIDLEKMEAVKTIDLGGPKEVTKIRFGERVFNSADITFRRQFSCHSCHPDGHVNGLTFDIEPDGIGISPVDNRTLRGIFDTNPFKWEGTNPTLQRQCGPRLAVFFTRIEPFTTEKLNALTEYICTIPRPGNRHRPLGAELTDAQRRGKRVFGRATTNDGRIIVKEDRCVSCHFPPLYTDRRRHDIGTKYEFDRESHFDTPHLSNIYASPPYLHNGVAETLEEIWTVYNPEDKHGVTNDLTKDQLNDLIEYLKTL